MVDLDAPLLESYIEAILQVSLTKPPVLVVAIFREDLPNVAPFYIFTAVSQGPWLQYILPASKGQFFGILKDMQSLPLKGTSPFHMLVSFFFTKFYFSLSVLIVYGFVNLLLMGSLKFSNNILSKFIFNTFIILEILLNVIINYEDYFLHAIWYDVVQHCMKNVGPHLSILQSITKVIEG